ncbi:MAG TPA: ribonuclease HI [Thermoanaerobaculia bacterium]|nr:ribonuclease HI [Thermoanaerobaculia bacterium]
MPDAPRRTATDAVTIYTDGGADPNPGPGGWGVVLIHPASGSVQELLGGEPSTTNNRMELTAAIHALETLRQPCRVEMHTDSQYLRRGITEWLPGWIARGWRRQTGELQNEDLWRRLAAAAANHDVLWKWVKGHAGDRHNERADQLATTAIREQRAAAAAAASAAGAAGSAAPEAPELEAVLRVSMTPRGGGWAVLIRPAGTAAAQPAETVLSGSLPPGAAATSNALDLAAVTAALEALPAGASVAVHTVSDYLRHGASRWLPAWQRRGWKTQEGGPVLNRALWERLAAAMAARRVSWPEVKGREVPELDRLAPIAKAAAQGQADRG